jgi:hypothetical protein
MPRFLDCGERIRCRPAFAPELKSVNTYYRQLSGAILARPWRRICSTLRPEMSSRPRTPAPRDLQSGTLILAISALPSMGVESQGRDGILPGSGERRTQMRGNLFRGSVGAVLMIVSWRAAKAQPYTPYVIVLKNSTINPDGSVDHVRTSLIGRRADGVRVLIDWSGKNQEKILRRIQYPEKGTWVIVDVPHKQKKTFGGGRPMDVSDGEPLCRYAPQEFDNVDKPGDIQGFSALHHRESMGSEAVHDIWLAPELGCEEIRVITTFTDGTVEKREPVTIKKAEPDAEYFFVPDGLTEVEITSFLGAVEGRELNTVLWKDRPAKSVAIPYTATQDEFWVGPHGEDRGHATHTFARKGDATTIVIDGKITVLRYGSEDRTVEFTHEDNKIFTMGTGAARTVKANEDCVHMPVNAETIGEDTILGHPATHIRIDSGPQMTIDRWHANDLACLMLQTIFTSNDGSRDIQKFTALTIGEPDEKLFQLPSNPHEVSPREFFKSTSHMQGDTPGDAADIENNASLDKLDEHYKKDKALRGE